VLAILLIIAAMFAAFAVWDLLKPARTFPASSLWRARGVAAMVLYFTVAFTAPLIWDAWLAERRLVDVTSLPLPVQIGLGFVALEFGIYVWHRSLHGVDVLWRHFHQTHHSAERIDVWGAFWFHPLDMLGWSLLGSLALVLAVGVSAEAAIAVNLITTFLAMFTHANIRTPHWVGWFVSRPEMHAVHHERGVHRYNYSDLPLFDMLFGTYRNPRSWGAQAGFFEGGSLKWWPLLIGRKIA
jgi:sterol desaturase/sphingolipid hydroxylase (fatty acid hydroxylase superfamily)